MSSKYASSYHFRGNYLSGDSLTMPRPPAFIHVDMDGLWAVRRCYGRPVRDTFRNDPVWEQGAPEFQRFFADHSVPASFFLVGADMKVPIKRRLAHQLAEAGHEIANHSWEHRIGLTQMGTGGIRHHIERGHEALVRAGLPAPVGFRSPGYDVDIRVIRVLRRLGYAYDASLLPTRLQPLLRLADAWLARRWQRGKKQFGRMAYALAPRVPYCPSKNRLRIPAPIVRPDFIEFPVTTLPPLNLPLTASGIFASGPEKTIRALRRPELQGKPLLFLLHGIDLTDCTRPIVFDSRRPRIGGFHRSAASKRRDLETVLRFVAENYEIVLTRDWATRALAPEPGVPDS